MFTYFINNLLKIGPIVIIAWFVISLCNFIKAKKKGGKPGVALIINIILSSTVIVIIIVALIYFFFIMPNPFAR